MNAAVLGMGGRVPARALLRAASLALCAAGLGVAAQGAWIPVKAETAQAALETQFEKSLAEHRPAAVVNAAIVAPKAKAPVQPAAKPAKLWQFVKHAPLARLSVDRLDLRDVVLAGDGSHEQLALGPTMIKRGTAESPVTVLAAHRDTHFAFIRNLQVGDEMTMEYTTGETERYRVVRFETVRWDEFAYPLNPVRPLLALTTCYPFGGTEYGGPLRRVVWAERVG